MHQYQRTLQEYRTTATPEEVLAEAKRFFTRHTGIYATFIDRDGPTFVSFRGQGGEELIIAAVAEGDATRVTGSTYLFDMQIARFFTTLPPFQCCATGRGRIWSRVRAAAPGPEPRPNR